MFTAIHLRSDTLNWFKLTLNNYLNNIISEWKNVTNKIFTDFKIFKAKIKVIFETIDKEHITELEVSLLRQIGAVTTYTVNF